MNTAPSPHTDATRLGSRRLGAAFPHRSPEEQRLLAENRRLWHRVEALESALYGAGHDDLNVPLPRMSRCILMLLMRQPAVTIDQMRAAMEAASPTPDGRSDNNVSWTLSHWVRPLLRKHGVEVSRIGWGEYAVTPEGKAALREAFGRAETGENI